MVKIERWLPVPGFEGLYEVSDLGGVRSIDRALVRRDGVLRRWPGRTLRSRPNRSGYLQVPLAGAGYRSVHLLVLSAFVGPRPVGHVGCHWDGDPSNNRVGNLRWDTASSNELDKRRHGTHHETRKTCCPRGHLLAPPNLRPDALSRGRRACLSCRRARDYVRRHPGADVDAVAEERYRITFSEAGWEW